MKVKKSRNLANISFMKVKKSRNLSNNLGVWLFFSHLNMVRLPLQLTFSMGNILTFVHNKFNFLPSKALITKILIFKVLKIFWISTKSLHEKLQCKMQIPKLNLLNGWWVATIVNLSSISAAVEEKFCKEYIEYAQLGTLRWILWKFQLNSFSSLGLVAMMNLSSLGSAV